MEPCRHHSYSPCTGRRRTRGAAGLPVALENATSPRRRHSPSSSLLLTDQRPERVSLYCGHRPTRATRTSSATSISSRDERNEDGNGSNKLAAHDRRPLTSSAAEGRCRQRSRGYTTRAAGRQVSAADDASSSERNDRRPSNVGVRPNIRLVRSVFPVRVTTRDRCLVWIARARRTGSPGWWWARPTTTR